MHVQSVQKYCFSLSNMQICGILVAVVVVVAKLPNERNENEYNSAVARGGAGGARAPPVFFPKK